MGFMQQSSPLLALISKRQCAQAYATRANLSTLRLYHAYTRPSSRQCQVLRRYASTDTESKSTAPKPSYNSSPEIVDKTAISNQFANKVLPSQHEYDENASPTSRKLGPTQSHSPFISDPHFNPPASTRPTALEVPTRQPNQSTIGYYIKVGRAYLTFYKRGLQNINANRKNAKEIRQRLKSHQNQYTAIMKVNPAEAKEAFVSEAAPWTRAEFQVLRRSRHDMSRLPAFGLMFLIFGEFLPLIMLAFKARITPILPYTVRLPSQIEADRAKMLKSRAAVEEKWKDLRVNDESIDTFALYGAEYFNLGVWGWPLRWQPNYVVLRHTRKYYEYLLYDDVLLGKNGVKALVDEEVIISAIERGLWDEQTSMKELRKRLQGAVSKSLKPIKDDSIYDKK